MIIRPEGDAELIAFVADVLSDNEISIEARGMLAALIVRRDLQHCPARAKLAALAGAGPYRIGTIINAAIASGYMRRAAGYVPRKNGRPLYSFIVGPRNG